nr:uncharacterized protein LOC117686688 [Crassostrea gigas]
MLRYKHWVFVGAVLLFGGCYGQVAPLYPAQSDQTSGSLVVAGSIGILSFAASAALAAMSGLQNTRIRNMPKEPDMTCEDNLAEEKEKCEEEKKDIRDGERAALESRTIFDYGPHGMLSRREENHNQAYNHQNIPLQLQGGC